MNRNTLKASDGHPIATYEWSHPAPRAVIYIAHGMGEHARRYDRIAGQLVDAGYVVYANDHRGHGETSGTHLGYMGPDGWNRTLSDMYEYIVSLRARHPGLKVCLLGHSMGAMLSEQFVTRHANVIDAMVLSGSPGFKAGSLLGRLILKFENWRLDPWEQSAVMQGALFGNANKPFDGPNATGSEWLSRDPAEVKKYVDDEKCGFVLSVGSLIDMYAGVARAQDPLGIEMIPAGLPCYVFSGSEDPVHGQCEDLDRMLAAYRERGIAHLDYRLYPGGRHEMFNETNRDEVAQDLISWLEKTL